MEKKHQWFIKFKANISGRNSIGDEVNIDYDVVLPLFAEDLADAKKQAEIAESQLSYAAAKGSYEFFIKYCKSLVHGDTISVSNFSIYEDANFC